MPPPPPPLWSLVEALARAAATAPLPPALRAFWALVAWSAQQAATQQASAPQTAQQDASPGGSASKHTSGSGYRGAPGQAHTGRSRQANGGPAVWAEGWGTDDPNAARDLFGDADEEPPDASPSPLGPQGDAGARTVASPSEWQGARLRAALASRDASAVWEALGHTPGTADATAHKDAEKRGRVLRRRPRRPAP